MSEMLLTGVIPIVVSFSKASEGMSRVYSVPSAPVTLSVPPSTGMTASTDLAESNSTPT